MVWPSTMTSSSNWRMIPIAICFAINAWAATATAPARPANLSNTKPVTPPSAAQVEPASHFSDLSLFLLGSGFAVFVALLGWSDQIRGLTRETYELQADFLKQYNLTKAELLPAIRAETADEQLQAFTALMQTNKLEAAGVRLLPLFRAWTQQHRRLDRMQSWKYRLTVALSLVFFAAGILVIFGCPEVIAIFPPAAVLASIFGLIIATNIAERRLHATLGEMMERI